jgi:hypothetical protein
MEAARAAPGGALRIARRSIIRLRVPHRVARLSGDASALRRRRGKRRLRREGTRPAGKHEDQGLARRRCRNLLVAGHDDGVLEPGVSSPLAGSIAPPEGQVVDGLLTGVLSAQGDRLNGVGDLVRLGRDENAASLGAASFRCFALASSRDSRSSVAWSARTLICPALTLRCSASCSDWTRSIEAWSLTSLYCLRNARIAKAAATIANTASTAVAIAVISPDRSTDMGEGYGRGSIRAACSA